VVHDGGLTAGITFIRMTKDNSLTDATENSVIQGAQQEESLPNDVIPPNKLTLEIIKKCFNKCVHCSAFVSEEDSKKVMTEDKAMGVVDQFSGMGGVTLNLTGGEPLLHPHLFDIAKYAKKKNLKVGLFTCGKFSEGAPTKEEQSTIIEKIVETEFDNIEMALHAPSAEMHDSITDVPGSFKRIYQFIKELASRTDRLEINFVPMQINAEELPEVVQFVASLGVRELNVLRFMAQGRGRENKEWLYLTNAQMVRLSKVALQLMNERGKNPNIRIGHPGDFTFLVDKKRIPDPCSAGISQCMVKVNGDVIPCPAFGELPEWVAGNAFSDTLSHVWNESQIFFSLRKFNPRNLRGKCRRCRSLKLCRGRCPAERIRQNRDLYEGPDPGCPKAE